jgi:hypothetical protein
MKVCRAATALFAEPKGDAAAALNNEVHSEGGSLEPPRSKRRIRDAPSENAEGSFGGRLS